MAGEWREVRLGEVVSINPDALGSDWPFSYLKYIDISSVGEGSILEPPRILRLDEAPSRAKRLVREGDTVLSTVRPGRRSMFFVKEPEPEWVVSTGFAVLRPRRDYIEPRYLYACVFDRGFTEFLVKREKGAAYPAVLPEDIADAIIILPPLPEQRAIAHILGTLDDKIEVNRRMSETLEQMARALFKAWFVDFEPVRAKCRGGLQTRPYTGLPAHLYDLFPDRLVDSVLGEIPEGWEVKPISELADVVGGSTPKTERAEYWEGGTHHWVTPKDLSALSMPVLLDTERKITDAGLAQISSGLLPQGTVLLSSRAPIGYLAIAEVPVAVNQGFIAMKPRHGTSNLFLLRWAQAFHEEIVRHANGSTFLEISKSSFRSIRTVAPTDAVMNAFDRMSQPLYRKVVQHERESRTLAALRDALLPKLISGELRVKDAEKFLRECGL